MKKPFDWHHSLLYQMWKKAHDLRGVWIVSVRALNIAYYLAVGICRTNFWLRSMQDLQRRSTICWWRKPCMVAAL